MMSCSGQMHGWMWGYMFGWLGLAAIGLGILAWALTRWLAVRPPPATDDTDQALALLRERFARGELNEAEYRDRRRVLDGGA